MGHELNVSGHLAIDLAALDLLNEKIVICLKFSNVTSAEIKTTMEAVANYGNIHIAELIFSGITDCQNLLGCRTPKLTFRDAQIHNMRFLKKLPFTFHLQLENVEVVGHHLTKELSYLSNVSELSLHFLYTITPSNENHFAKMTSLTKVNLWGTSVGLLGAIVKNPEVTDINICEADLKRVLKYLSNSKNKYRLRFSYCMTTPALKSRLESHGTVVWA